jgi:hypothetical protein
LRLDHETLSFDSGWSAVTIPLSSIQGMFLGLYPWFWPVRIIPLLYLAVTYTEHGMVRTLLFTPTQSGMVARQETNKVVQEWLWLLYRAVLSRTGRALSLKPTDEALAPAWMRNTPGWVWYLLTAAMATVSFAGYAWFFFHHQSPSWIDLLLGFGSAAIVFGWAYGRSWWYRRRLAALTADEQRAVPPGFAPPVEPDGAAGLVLQGPLWLAEQVLLLFDFTATIPVHVWRAKRRCFNFWPFLLLNCSNLAFIVTGMDLTLLLASGWLHQAHLAGLDLRSQLMVLLFSGVGRLTALNMGFNDVAADGRPQTTRDITRRRVGIVFLTLTGVAALVFGVMPLMRNLLDAASPDSISSFAPKLKWAGISIVIVAAIGVFARIVFLFIRFIYRETVRSWPEVKQATDAAMKQAAEARAHSTPAQIHPLPPRSSPLTRAQVWQIYGHMTGGEKMRIMTFGGFYGIWNSATFFLPFACIMFFPIPVPLNWIIAMAVLLAGLAFYPLWWKQQAKLYCATAWAREKGIQMESIRSFPLGSTGLMLLGVLWLALVGAIWWQTYRPDGVWLPYLSVASLKEPGAGGAACVTDVRQYGQTVWLRLTCDPLPRSAVLSPSCTGPLIELPYRLPMEATNVDCLITTAPHSTGKVIAGADDLSGKTNFTVAFVLPDEPAAAAAVKQIRRLDLGRSHGVDSPLFCLRRTLGKDSNGRVMAEEIFAALQLQGRGSGVEVK